MKRLTRLGVAAVAAALVVPISGCAGLISPQQTAKYHYNGGDGAATSLQNVDVRGLLLIANEKADKAQLFYTLVNHGDSPARVTLNVGDTTVTNTVKAGGVFQQNPQNPEAKGTKEVLVKGLNVPTGSLVDVKVSVNSKSTTVRAQVLDGTHWYYKTLEPTSDTETTAPESEAPTEGSEHTTGH